MPVTAMQPVNPLQRSLDVQALYTLDGRAQRIRIGWWITRNVADRARIEFVFYMSTRTPKSKARLSYIGRWLRRVVFVVLVTGMLLTLPLRWIDPPTTAFMLQDDRREHSRVSGWTEFTDLGENLKLAVVASEDQRFAQHAGLDLASIKASLDDRKNGGRLRGASTLTQQFVKNQYLWSGRNLFRKGTEAWLAVNLDLFVSKARILELYLNVVEFGPGIYGAAEASQYYFGKTPAQLSEGEAALLAAVLPSPKRYNIRQPTAYMRERQAWIQQNMARLKREQWLTTITR